MIILNKISNITHKKFFTSQSGKYLFLLSVIGLTIALPCLPLAGEIGLVPIPLINLGAMLAIVAADIITADMLKIWFFTRYKEA